MKDTFPYISIVSRIPDLNFFKQKRWIILVSLVLLMIVLSVLHDYIYASLKSSGFYLSESMLYQSFWLFFIPLLGLFRWVVRPWKTQPSLRTGLIIFSIGLGFALMHIVLFVGFFVLVSSLSYEIPHRFTTLLNTAIANELYVSILIYSVLPIFWFYLKYRLKSPQTTGASSEVALRVKKGGKVLRVALDEIYYLAADRPYVAVHCASGKFLLHKSLKHYEDHFKPSSLLRVHRSVLLNPSAIVQFSSRKNGDYDAELSNGDTVRLSRHYRANWQGLLQ